MEKLSRELLETRGDEVAFRVVNFEKPGNEHYLFDYDLYTTTIVLIEQKDGVQTRWKNLQDSWKHAEETGDFKEYLTDEIAAFARGAIES